MAIRFHCKRCNQLLGIASRKAGSEIQCPKCGIGQIVPSEEAAAAAMAMSQYAKTPVVDEDIADFVVYDDEPAAIEMPRLRPSDASPQAPGETDANGPPSAPQGVGPAAEQPAGKPVPEGLILFPRRSFYLQGLLFAILAVAAFAAGYYIGRGDATIEQQIAQQPAAKQSILLEGKLVYNPGTGRIAGDRNAVIIALPEGNFPQRPLSIDGIRPQDRPPQGTQKTVRLIEELGGAYARADGEGNFSMLVPDRGSYHLLILSRHTQRGEDTPIDELDLAEIQKYFASADHLVDRLKYRWKLKEIDIGAARIEENFGRDGQNE